MSSVIKAGGPARNIQSVAFNFEDMTVQANKYLEGVRAQAGQIIAAAEKEAEIIRARSEEEGKHAALRAVERVLDEKVGKRMESLLPALKRAIEDIGHAKQAWLQHWERSAVHLASAIAARVIRKELTRSHDITTTLVAEALELAAGSSGLRIYLHPSDHETLGSQVQALTKEMNRIGSAEVVADPQISPGGCRVETRHGTIDQTFEAQLARIEAELM